jgi:hypothetical protein
MPNCHEDPRRAGPGRCAVCDTGFGLIRYYSWCTPFCSRKCADRFGAHRTSDRNSLLLVWQQMALEQASENRRRAL